MREFMYDQPSILIASILFVSMLLSIELGYRLGKGSRQSEMSKGQVSAIQGSLLGVLALLLGFTFSLALQRYDSRSAAVVDEANAIGTSWLRAQMLPGEMGKAVEAKLREYTAMRVASAKISLDHAEQREAMLADAARLQADLWTLARQAVALDDRMVTTGLFIQSLNDTIDAFGTRDAALNRHVPEVVLILLYITFLMTGSILGYGSGVSGHRASPVAYVMVGLIVLLVFIIIDLDRPRRGLIEVRQDSLMELHASMERAALPEAQAGSADPR